jgi:hypothetical protein
MGICIHYSLQFRGVVEQAKTLDRVVEYELPEIVALDRDTDALVSQRPYAFWRGFT